MFEDYKILSDLVSFWTTNSDFYQVLQSQTSIKTFLKKNYENEKKKLSWALFQWSGGGANRFSFYLAFIYNLAKPE